MRLPKVIAHADWSTAGSGRAIVTARREGDHRYTATLQLNPFVGGLLEEWLAVERGETAFIGFDFPIGFPRAFAARRAINSFPDFLRKLSPDDALFSPAPSPGDIGLERPFYPARPGQTRFTDLTGALGLSRSDLLRACDRPTNAACMFWTLGPQQCGKAALAGWRELIGPALRRADRISLWPYDGPLTALLERPGVVLSETYPAHGYRALELLPVVKSTLQGRQRSVTSLEAWVTRLDLKLEGQLADALPRGFSKDDGGDHAFDALVGLLLMVAICQGRCPYTEPNDPAARTVEGWMLGLSPAVAASTQPISAT